MPELPEVEVLKNELIVILNKKIINIKTSNKNLHGKKIPDMNSLIGDKFTNIYRRNKYLILESSHYYLVVHLGMTGQLKFEDNIPDEKHIHIIISFSDKVLYYKDIRRFGSISLYDKNTFPNYLIIPLFTKLGVEPLSPEFTIETLNKYIDDSKSSSKSFIMNGNYICGIGNIYASEILFLSKISPQIPINSISIEQRNFLFKNIIDVLSKAILMGGSTISDFVHLNGQKGSMQEHYYVYGRTNQPCKICTTLIQKIKQNGRSSFYCPSCQNTLN